jgi:hypothetical protein
MFYFLWVHELPPASSTSFSQQQLGYLTNWSQSRSHIVTDGQSISKSWCRVPSGAHDQICIYYSLTVTFLFFRGALSDERTGLSFIYAPGPRQHSLSRVRVPLDSWRYFTVSDLRLSFSSPPTTRRVTVEVFELASTRVTNWRLHSHHYIAPARAAQKTPVLCCSEIVASRWYDVFHCWVCSHRHGLHRKQHYYVVYEPLPRNFRMLYSCLFRGRYLATDLHSTIYFSFLYSLILVSAIWIERGVLK